MTTTSLPTLYQQVIHMSRYSRFRDDYNVPRREEWDETLNRWFDFWVGRYPEFEDTLKQIRDRIEVLDGMPSMRSVMTAGKALDRDEVASFNCAFSVIDSPRAFDELMYILMCGTGIGFSVQSRYVNKLPEVSEDFMKTDTTIVVPDSKIGWASSFKELLSLLYVGKIPKYDLSKIRPKGTRLKTFGGRASGPEPLEDLFLFAIDLFRNAAGRKLSTLECHDLACKIADIVVVGGVRRSALISLSDLSDDKMRNCKTGAWWEQNPQRRLANNSYVAEERPDFQVFLDEWTSLYKSFSGERGIFSLPAARKVAERNGRRDAEQIVGTNPCAEILLRDKQMCNLSEVVVRPEDDLESLKKKVQTATIIGTFQSTLTNFRYLRKKWKDNCNEERLLGVSLTGICDNRVMNGQEGEEKLIAWLEELNQAAVDTNAEWADNLGIPRSTAITTIKPSGTVSQLVDSASGIHPRFSKYYIRRIRQNREDPLCDLLIDEGVQYEVDRMDKSSYVFSFPIKAPEDSLTNADMGAMRQLRLWRIYAKHWCEHKPSMTCYYQDSEFMEIGNWIWNNFDEVSGISFLPLDDHIYPQAPYEPIDEETYEEMRKNTIDEIDWTKMANYEKEDNTTSSQELACSAGGCEI